MIVHYGSCGGWRRQIVAAWVACLVAACSPAAQAAEPTPQAELAAFCAVPENLSDGGFLKHAREAYRAGKPLRIVAFGTSSSAGTGAASRANAYPARLQADLQERFAKVGAESMPMTPADFETFKRAELALTSTIVKAANIRIP